MQLDFDEIYRQLAHETLVEGVDITEIGKFHKGREGKNIKLRAVFGKHFKYDLEKQGLPILGLRRLNPKVFIGELVWFLMGDNNPNGLVKRFTRIWDDFIEDDGTVTSYGYRWRRGLGRDQLYGVIETLKRDPTSRHAVIITWDASSDSMVNGVVRKNVPCHVAMTFMVDTVNQRLNMSTFWRSQDLYLGFPNDVASGGILLAMVAAALGLKPGYYDHFVANLHFYENQYEKVRKILEIPSQNNHIYLELPQDWFEHIDDYDYAYDFTNSLISQFKKQYKYDPTIGSVKIVV